MNDRTNELPAPVETQPNFFVCSRCGHANWVDTPDNTWVCVHCDLPHSIPPNVEEM